MRLQTLYVSNFLGVAAADLQLNEPIQLFAGRNGAGKSSLRDAIALALTGDLGRVSQKKESGQLVRAGASAACCEVVDADGDQFSVTITAAGKVTDSQKGRDVDPALRYVLDGQRFARLDASERRAFLYGLMGIKTGAAEIASRLKAHACDAEKIERLVPLLRTGFDAACTEAKEKATSTKAVWRALTGENYGSEKAKAWRAQVPAFDAAAAKATATELEHADLAIGQWQQQIGKLQGTEERRAELQAQLPALRDQAGMIARIEAKLRTDEEQLAGWEADLVKTKAAAGAGPRVGLVHDLAEQLAAVLEHGERVGWFADSGDRAAASESRTLLDRYEAEHGQIGAAGGDGKARARLPSIQKSRDLMASAVANDKRDLDGARLAQSMIERIEVELAEAFDADALQHAREQLTQLQAQRADLVKQVDTFRTLKLAADTAEKKTSEAARHAAAVAAWDAIGDALSPAGIPAEILAEALGPIKERLDQTALDTGWPRVEIGADLAITAASRDYRLLSESEKWRVDAMLAEAIAQLSGVRLLVLDRIDVLDLPARGELFGWMHTLADLGELDTALLFGTLKAAPSGLPATMAAHWVEGGVVGQMKEAA